MCDFNKEIEAFWPPCTLELSPSKAESVDAPPNLDSVKIQPSASSEANPLKLRASVRKGILKVGA
jgi:hypothetical protein